MRTLTENILRESVFKTEAGERRHRETSPLLETPGRARELPGRVRSERHLKSETGCASCVDIGRGLTGRVKKKLEL